MGPHQTCCLPAPGSQAPDARTVRNYFLVIGWWCFVNAPPTKQPPFPFLCSSPGNRAFLLYLCGLEIKGRLVPQWGSQNSEQMCSSWSLVPVCGSWSTSAECQHITPPLRSLFLITFYYFKMFRGVRNRAYFAIFGCFTEPINMWFTSIFIWRCLSINLKSLGSYEALDEQDGPVSENAFTAQPRQPEFSSQSPSGKTAMSWKLTSDLHTRPASCARTHPLTHTHSHSPYAHTIETNNWKDDKERYGTNSV